MGRPRRGGSTAAIDPGLDALDINGDGVVDPDDLAQFIAWFFGGSSTESGAFQTDYNGINGTNPEDLADYIGAFFAWDPNTAPAQARPTLAMDHGALSRPGVENRLGYCGYVWDRWLAVYHVRHRVYEPYHGRWYQPDPIEFAGGRNWFEYCGGSPGMYSDPWGLCGSSAQQDGASVAVLDANKKKFCDQLAQLLKDGRLSEEKFKKLYAGSKCGQTVSSEISSGYWGGFWKGAHDGYIQTSASALNVLTFGVFGIEDMPTEYGWLYDPDLPELLASKYAGRVAGTALAIVLPARFAGFGNSATVVTRWGRPGSRSGDWVMTGGKTWFN